MNRVAFEHKLNEIERDGHVVVTMQSSTKFISLSGRATPVDDREKLARLWKAEWKIWFPDGKDDPNIRLLRIDGDTGEYWDNSGTSGVKYLIEAGKALMTGSRPDVGKTRRSTPRSSCRPDPSVLAGLAFVSFGAAYGMIEQIRQGIVDRRPPVALFGTVVCDEVD